MMTNEEILRIAMEQSAEDIGCQAGDFLADSNIIVPFRPGPNAKKYYKMPIASNFISYGNNVVAAATDEVFEIVRKYIDRFSFYHCFETPNMRWLNERLQPLGHTVCFMAEYYLPDMDWLTEMSCDFELRTMTKGGFEDLYLPEWANALCEDRKPLDMLAVGAFDNGRLIGLAGCSADADEMWQIGVDVLPEYRRQGVASAITSKLAFEIMDAGKIPFYCSAWSNIRSVRNAIKCGFLPAWVEMTVKPVDAVDEMNG